ncbi:hypothetical protein Pfo_028177 [Paulownia fortunei]|nr:hypothetical protein Pfo_028177 [Paulownia fortunei]
MPNKFFYQCKVCQFSLHKVCYSMPKRVMHPADPNHHLTLSASSFTNQSTECEACGRCIAGFYYNCTKCSLYYHMLCVAMPLSVKIPSSHPHILKLELKPPYDFQCDLCDRPSYSGWLYRCRLCEFDAHISCAVTFKGTQSPLRSLGSKSHQHELMELLSEGMKKGIQVNNEKNLDRDQFQPLDQSILISEDFTLPSYHFSDACFSIDIAKSIWMNENTNEASREAFNHQVQLLGSKETEKDWTVTDSKHTKEKLEVARRQSFDFGKKYLKRELSLAPSTGMGSYVWEELGQENKKGNLNATNDRMQLKDQTTEIENVNLRRPFWSKLLMCF